VTTIPIHETFQATVQGEGYWAGTLVDFIRLAGCPVGCPWCDTGYADGGANLPRQLKSFETLIAELRSPRTIISGGEPFIYSDLPALVRTIEATGRTVGIETSGAFWQNVSPTAWVTLSPKEHLNPRYPVIPGMWERANEIKLVVETGKELEFYDRYLPSQGQTPVFLQPEWSQRDRAIPLILEHLQRFPEYKLSVQLHKYINVP